MELRGANLQVEPAAGDKVRITITAEDTTIQFSLSPRSADRLVEKVQKARKAKR